MCVNAHFYRVWLNGRVSRLSGVPRRQQRSVRRIIWIARTKKASGCPQSADDYNAASLLAT